MRLCSYASETLSYASIIVSDASPATSNAAADIPEASHASQASLHAARAASHSLYASRQETRVLIVCEKGECLLYIAYLKHGTYKAKEYEMEKLITNVKNTMKWFIQKLS